MKRYALLKQMDQKVQIQSAQLQLKYHELFLRINKLIETFDRADDVRIMNRNLGKCIRTVENMKFPNVNFNVCVEGSDFREKKFAERIEKVNEKINMLEVIYESK